MHGQDLFMTFSGGTVAWIPRHAGITGSTSLDGYSVVVAIR
jgi:hypothetical protein